MKISRDQIYEAFSRLSAELAQREVRGELCLFGGGVMVLVFDARHATRDIDGIFRPPEIIRECAEVVGTEMGLPERWLNDGVKGFVSAQEDFVTDGLPLFSHLRLVRPSDRYLLAMKCLAARSAGYETDGDRRDVEFLVRRLGLKTAADVMAVVTAYYPPQRIAAKTRYYIEEIMQELDPA